MVDAGAVALDLPSFFTVLTQRQHYSYVNTTCVHEVITGVMRLCLEHGVRSNELGVRDVDQAIRHFLQEEKEKCEKVTTNNKKKRTWFGIHSTKCLNKTYHDLDTTNLMEIIPRITEIKQENPDVHFKSLWNSIRDIKNIRNDVVHVDNNATYSDQTIPRISDVLNEIVNKLGILFKINSTEVDSIKNKFHDEILRIQDNQQSNEDNVKSEITNRVTNENREKWAPTVMNAMQYEKLQFCNELVSRSDIFHVSDFEVILVSNYDNPQLQGPKIFSCTDILSQANITMIDIIEGDPGSGKSTFLRMMSLEFCKKQSDSIFKLISSYSMMMLINCRDKENIRTFWQYFEKHHKETASIFPEKWVIFALREMKMIIAIDGLDEANEAAKALVRDVIHHFAGSETIRFLITTRPGFRKNVIQQLDQNAIQYRVLNIKPLENINDQEEFIRRVASHMSEINVEDIMLTFREKYTELNSHFLHPLGLILFIVLFRNFPDEIDKLTHGLSLMQLSYKMHSQNITERISYVICNYQKYSKAVLELTCRKSLQLIQNKCFEINEENFNSLTDACYKMNKNIPAESVFSCVLMQRKSDKNTITSIRDFSHRSQQEYFASKVLTEKLCEDYSKREMPLRVEEATSGAMLQVLQKLTGETVEEGDLDRFVKQENTK